MPQTASVTPTGVRDGDPAALIGLCDVRGPSVLAYCRHLVGEADAGDAAAEAFARFRAAVVATPQPSELNPEVLLISATRRAAARRAAGSVRGDCSEVPELLAARADKTISAADRARLDDHLESCWTCRAPVARFEAAERAYRDPREPGVQPEIAAQIFVALVAAAPSRAASSPDGDEPDPPTEEVAPSASARSRARTDAGAGATSARGRSRARAAAGAAVAAPAAVGAASISAGLPRASRASRPGPVRARRGRTQRGRPRPARRLPLVLPIALVLVAFVLALVVSGVVGGDEPASSPRVSAPGDVRGNPADLEPVPEAEDASADAVEAAKARARERASGPARKAKPKPKRAAKPKRRSTAAPAAPPEATTPPPPPPAVAPPPPPPPPAASKADNGRAGSTKKSSPSRRVDAGKGATGAEQIPPAKDSSNVPDLAPPPEPATSP